MANYHKLGRLKQQTFILSQLWKVKPQIKVHSPSKGSRESSFLPLPILWSLQQSLVGLGS